MKFDNNKYFQAAQEFIRSTDLNSLPAGKNVIDGENLYVNVVNTELRPAPRARFEAHDQYIDIQVPLSGPETYASMPRRKCVAQCGEYNPADDIVFFDDPVADFTNPSEPAPGVKFETRQPGEQIVFGPDDAHAPLIGEGKIHKVIFKVKVV